MVQQKCVLLVARCALTALCNQIFNALASHFGNGLTEELRDGHSISQVISAACLCHIHDTIQQRAACQVPQDAGGRIVLFMLE